MEKFICTNNYFCNKLERSFQLKIESYERQEGGKIKEVIYLETYPKKNKLPVKIPPRGDFTPDAWFTAVLVKEPVTGIERTKDPIMLQIPSANISCVTSKDFPIAVKI